MLKTLKSLFVLAIFAMVLFYAFKFDFFNFENTTHTEQGIIRQSVEKKLDVVLVVYNYQDMVNHEVSLAGGYATSNVALKVIGSAEGRVNGLDAVIKETETSINVSLPAPEIFTKIDHSASEKLYDHSSDAAADVYNFFTGGDSLTKNMDNHAWEKAELAIEKAAVDNGIIKETMQEAELRIKELLSLTGKNVTVTFRGGTESPKIKKESLTFKPSVIR